MVTPPTAASHRPAPRFPRWSEDRAGTSAAGRPESYSPAARRRSRMASRSMGWKSCSVKSGAVKVRTA